MQRVTSKLGASSGEPFHCAKNSKICDFGEKHTPWCAMQKIWPPVQKNHHPTGHQIISKPCIWTLRFKGPKGNHVHMVGTSPPESQHAMARLLLVGLARWERRLRSCVRVLNVTRINELKTMQKPYYASSLQQLCTMQLVVRSKDMW